MEKNKVLVIVAHPDDEILGVGGTLIKHVNQGDDIFCLILGEGITSRDKYGQGVLEELHEHCHEAGKVIGFQEIFLLKLPDNKFDSIPLLNIVKEIEKYLEKIKPNIIYTHHDGDVNIDHQLTHEAVMVACRPCNPNCPGELYSFETLSSTEWQINKKKLFTPNIYVDIEYEINSKIKALKKYKSEVREYPHSRSVEGIKILAQFRGLESGLKYAEAFYLLREVKR
ncbi:MAG: PIG-L family deacetylase [Nanoarchaeota archaeon]|nr:PIG-L family deacetylase [Nanoarchaeota archaeon]